MVPALVISATAVALLLFVVIPVIVLTEAAVAFEADMHDVFDSED